MFTGIIIKQLGLDPDSSERNTKLVEQPGEGEGQQSAFTGICAALTEHFKSQASRRIPAVFGSRWRRVTRQVSAEGTRRKNTFEKLKREKKKTQNLGVDIKS